MSGLISAIIFSMGPVYARLRGLETSGVATFMAVSILAAVVTQYPVGRLSDRMDRRTVIAIVCTLATAVAGSIVAFPHLPRSAFLALAALFSGLVLTLYSLSVSHVNDKLEPTQMVAASSALLLLNGVAASSGARRQPDRRFWTAGVFRGRSRRWTGTLAIYDLWRKSRRTPVPPSQKGRSSTRNPGPDAYHGHVIGGAGGPDRQAGFFAMIQTRVMAQIPPATATGTRCISNCEVDCPCATHIPASAGPAMDPVRPHGHRRAHPDPRGCASDSIAAPWRT